MKQEPMLIHQILLIMMIGLAAGILSGLVGIGGGIILVPAVIYFLHYTQHQAQGTSLGVLTIPVTIFAFFSYYLNCKKTGNPIDFKVIALLSIGFGIGGFFGGQLAVKIDRDMLRKIFAIVLLFTAFNMLKWDMLLIRWFRKIF